jgi:hypothetical protein
MLLRIIYCAKAATELFCGVRCKDKPLTIVCLIFIVSCD